MRRIKKITAAVCVAFASLAVFAKPKLSDEQKGMVNLLVRLNQNFMLTEPCLAFNPKLKKVYVTQIEYSDIKNNIVDFGDWEALAVSNAYAFNKNLMESTESLVQYKEKTERKIWCQLTSEDDEIQIAELIDCYDEYGQLHPDWGTYWTYKIENNTIKILEGKIYGKNEIIKTEKGYDIFLYGSKERKKNMFLTNENKIQKIEKTGDNGAWWKYENGILMEEYSSGVLYRYTTANGKGEYQKREENGTFKTVAILERKTDKDGYLTYQKIEYPDGRATEIFIGEKLPDISRLVNRLFAE